MVSHIPGVHGELIVATFGQVLWLRVVGATNREFATMMEQRVIEVTTPICDKPWIGVNDVLEWKLGGPDTVAAMNPLMHWFESHNRSHSINLLPDYVLHDVSLQEMMKGVVRHSERIVLHSVAEAIEKVTKMQPDFDSQEMLNTIYADRPVQGLT
jgi:hypothetical protein